MIRFSRWVAQTASAYLFDKTTAGYNAAIFMPSPSVVPLQDRVQHAEVQPADLLQVLEWLGEAAGAELDVVRAEAALGPHPLRLDAQAGARALLHAVTDGGLEVGWRELQVRDAGRLLPWATMVPSSGMLVYAEGMRWGRHRVRLVLDGVVRRETLRTTELAALLGVAASAVVLGISASPSRPLDKLRAARPDLEPWRRARALIYLDADDAKLAAVYGVAIGILSLTVPLAVQAVVNTVSFGAVLQPLIVLTALVAIVLTLSGTVRVLQAKVVESILARMYVRAVTDLARRLLQVERAALDQINTAEVTSRFLEIPVIQKALAVLLIDGIDLVLKLLIGLALLAFYHPLLLVFSLGLLLSLAIVVFAGGRGAVKTALDESSAKYAAASWIEHLVRMPGGLRSTAARGWAIGRADRLARRYRDARGRHFAKLLRQIVGGIGIKVIGSAMLLGIGGSLVLAQQLTLGQLVASELVFASISLALIKLHKQLEAAYDLMASSAKFGLLVDLPLERTGGELVTARGPARVQLRGVAFGHRHGPQVLQGATLDIEPGERLVLDGAPGIGTSTVLDVLALQRAPTAGQLRLDGIDVRLLELAHARTGVVLVRDPELMHDTLLENLRCHRPDAELREVEAAIEATELGDVVTGLPQGLATPVVPSGLPLSRTQVRRVALARALIARPRLLLIDGGLDDLGLSAEAKARVLDRVLGDAAPATTIVVTSDDDVRRRCARRLRLEARQLVEVR